MFTLITQEYIWKWEATNTKINACGKDVQIHLEMLGKCQFIILSWNANIAYLDFIFPLLKLSEIIGMLVDFLAGTSLLLK